MTEGVRVLDSRQERALGALLAGQSAAKAAEAAGVSERTVGRWSAGEEFAAERRHRARMLAAEAASDLLAAQGEAVRALRFALTTGSPATTVRAARVVLEVGARLLDDDVEQRLADLERRWTSWGDGVTRIGSNG